MGVVLYHVKIYRLIEMVTDKPTFHLTDEIESMDIDTEFDFMVAEYIYKKLNERVHNIK